MWNTPWKYVVVIVMLASGVPQAVSAEQVLLESNQVKITSLDFEAEMLRIPVEHREEFLTSKERIRKLLENMLVSKTLAGQARKAGIDNEPLMKKRLELAVDKLLSQEQVNRSVDSLKLPNFEPRARELYKINTEKYTLPAKIHASHILVDSKNRSDEEALKRIQEARVKALEGKSFDALAQEYSDDPSAKENKGDLGFFEAGNMVKPFSDAAFALSAPGEISEPVKTQFGYHIIRLHEKQAAKLRPFEEVKEEIVKGLRDKYVADYRNEQIGKIISDPSLKLYEEAVDRYHVNIDHEAAGQKK
ncbi:MAG: peptidylprolyl isomerase [Sulfuricellaceae bacterium]